ncbi:hypothetical protein [Streptomyces sp. NBC_01314]|uniref:hypothetical protein n=1 Tax=Streptomyces sp. NBC_01314 TaxID=2903821 RepID=UPI003093A63F|nr:hypothetical protein OG622_22435 [Streptomyces sp. NBC_01314]
MTRSTESPEGERLSLDLGADLTARLRARAKVNRRPVDAAVAAADARIDRLMGPAADEQGGPPAGDPPDGRGV